MALTGAFSALVIVLVITNLGIIPIGAVASITIDDCFVVHDIKIVEGNEGMFLAMPSRKTPQGEFKDIAHPINTETRQELLRKILAAFEEEKKNPHE